MRHKVFGDRCIMLFCEHNFQLVGVRGHNGLHKLASLRFY